MSQFDVVKLGLSIFQLGHLEHMASKATALGHKKYLKDIPALTYLCSEVTHIAFTYSPLARNSLITENFYKGS